MKEYTTEELIEMANEDGPVWSYQEIAIELGNRIHHQVWADLDRQAYIYKNRPYPFSRWLVINGNLRRRR